MKRSLKIILLLCILVICIGGYLLISKQSKQTTTAATESKEAAALTEHTVEELAALSWTAEDGSTLRFTKSDAGWSYDADNAFPANETTLNSLADKLAALTADRSIDNVTDLSIYGLSEPAFTLTAEWIDGTSTVYTLGDATAFADGYYVSRSGDSKVYIVGTSLKSTFQKTLNNLAVKETLPTVEQVTRVTAGPADASYEEVSRTINTDQHWYAPDGTPLDSAAVESLISAIKAISWGDLVSGSATDDALSTYGLTEPAATLCLYDGEAPVLTLQIGNTNEDGDYYVKLPDSGMVYTVTADSLSKVLSVTADGLKAESTLLTLPYEDVLSAQLKAGNVDYALQTIDLRSADEEVASDAEPSSTASTTEADSAASETAIEAEPAPDPTEDDETLWKQLTVISATGNAESKDGETVLTVSVTNQNGITAELVIREYDADSYQAALNDGSSVTVSADLVDKLIRMLKQMK